MISQTVLHNALDTQSVRIVSIDIAHRSRREHRCEVAGRQAAADLRVAQAEAEKRRAAAVAREQEMRALVEENRAKVVEAEAQVPQAIADAFQKGNIGVMDFYNMKNVQSDTSMRNNIASMTGGGENAPGRGS